jgi:sugar (pentulose or hexulose) kinase
VGTPVALGIDMGTTAIKAATVGLDGSELDVVSVLTPWTQSADGPQLDVDALGDLAVALAGQAAQRAADAGRTVRAVGVTGMAETGALLGPDGHALAPGFAWHHTLGNPDRVQEALGRRTFIRTTGRDATISPSIVKLDMLRAGGHVFAPGQCWLNIPDYVAYRLSGVRAAELSTSCRTGLVDLRTATWWDEALEFLGTGRWLLPGDPVPGGTLLGPVRDDAPAALRGAVAGTGGHDHPTASVGIGCTGPDDLALSLGTAEAQLRFLLPPVDPQVVERLVALGGSVDWHPLGDRLTVVLALPTGITLARLARLLGCSTTEDRLALSRAALATGGEGRDGVRLDRPTWDSFALTAISDEATRVGTWRSVTAQLTETARSFMAQVSEVVGPWRRAVAFGGSVRDPLFRRLRDEAFGAGLEYVDVEEPGTVGAALLAARAAGEISELPRAVRGADVR